MSETGNISNYIEYSTVVDIDNRTLSICLWILYTALCQTLNVFGIVTNVINIIGFVKQGFQDSVTVSLLGLSISDLCSLITMAWSCVSLTPAFAAADLPFDSLEITYLVSAIPHFAFTRVSSCITAMITVERCLSVTAPLKVKHIINPHRSGAIIIFIYAIFVLSNAPFYIVNRLGTKYSPIRNKSIIGINFTRDREQVERVALSINNFIIPLCAFIVVAITTAVLAIQLDHSSTWSKDVISDAQAVRISNRNKQVAKMVVTISILFISCYAPIVLTMTVVAFVPGMSIAGKYMNITMVIGGITYTLESVNSSMNIFIYHSMSSKYRNTLRKMFTKVDTSLETH